MGKTTVLAELANHVFAYVAGAGHGPPVQLPLVWFWEALGASLLTHLSHPNVMDASVPPFRVIS